MVVFITTAVITSNPIQISQIYGRDIVSNQRNLAVVPTSPSVGGTETGRYAPEVARRFTTDCRLL
jgi:hypothetical protein